MVPDANPSFLIYCGGLSCVLVVRLVRWVASEMWSACSVACGGGVSTRTVQCQVVSNGTVVPDALCADSVTPDRVKPCGTQVRLT